VRPTHLLAAAFLALASLAAISQGNLDATTATPSAVLSQRPAKRGSAAQCSRLTLSQEPDTTQWTVQYAIVSDSSRLRALRVTGDDIYACQWSCFYTFYPDEGLINGCVLANCNLSSPTCSSCHG